MQRRRTTRSTAGPAAAPAHPKAKTTANAKAAGNAKAKKPIARQQREATPPPASSSPPCPSQPAQPAAIQKQLCEEKACRAAVAAEKEKGNVLAKKLKDTEPDEEDNIVIQEDMQEDEGLDDEDPDAETYYETFAAIDAGIDSGVDSDDDEDMERHTLPSLQEHDRGRKMQIWTLTSLTMLEIEMTPPPKSVSSPIKHTIKATLDRYTDAQHHRVSSLSPSKGVKAGVISPAKGKLTLILSSLSPHIWGMGGVAYSPLASHTWNKKLPFGCEGISHLLRAEFFATKGGANIAAFKEMVSARRIGANTIALAATAYAEGALCHIEFSNAACSRYLFHLSSYHCIAHKGPVWADRFERSLFTLVLNQSNKAFLLDVEADDMDDIDIAALEAEAISAAAAQQSLSAISSLLSSKTVVSSSSSTSTTSQTVAPSSSASISSSVITPSSAY
ncbi:hypothetical protein BT96DRAFT_1008356 [Gymnopus androsaceus JB14]|uniref:Uncharacterized protein n=1 Tax=Gymnopus androsaceus JB14 TaxID=1447944 RepID=A0A6A4GFI3_9AGAR|nr:hypothetical protein BT96DRAFT_1008356 [Gymnopus androsaceus JB14]